MVQSCGIGKGHPGKIVYEGAVFEFEDREHTKHLPLVELDELMYATAFYFDEYMGFSQKETLAVIQSYNHKVLSEPFECLTTVTGLDPQTCAGLHWADHLLIKFAWKPGECLSQSALPHEWIHAILDYYTDYADGAHQIDMLWDGLLWSVRTQTIKEYCEVPNSVEHSTEACGDEE